MRERGNRTENGRTGALAPTMISKILKEVAGRRTALYAAKCGLASAVSSNRVDNLQAALEPHDWEEEDGVYVEYVYTHTYARAATYMQRRAVSAVATFWRANKSPSTCDRNERQRQAALIRWENTIRVACLILSCGPRSPMSRRDLRKPAPETQALWHRCASNLFFFLKGNFLNAFSFRSSTYIARRGKV